MATISSTLAINDQMTPVLRTIASALESVNATLARIEATLPRTFDPRDIRPAVDAINDVEEAQDNVTDSLRESSNVADGLWGKLKGLVMAYASWELVKTTALWSDEVTNVTARLERANDGTMTTAQYMNEIYLSAQRSHAPFQQMADLVGKLRNQAKEAFTNNAEAIKFAEQLNKQFSIAGASQQGASDATFQLIQALGAGALRGEELNSVLDQAPNIVRTIAEHMQVPMGQIRELASQGKITADVVKNAMLGATEETNQAFNKVPLTFGSAWTMVKNTFQMNMLGLQKTISSIINTGQFQAIMDSVTSAISGFAQVAIPIVKGVADTIGFMYRNWDLLAPVIFGVVGALLAYKAVASAVMAIEKISLAIKVIGASAQVAYAVAMGTATSATIAQTTAQWGLNTAMLANPVGLIIAGIGLLIGALYGVIAIINRVTGSTYSATAIITGVLYSLWAYINNIVASVWNIVLSLAEFFMNVWTNPVHSVQMLIYNLLDTFKGLFMGIIQGLDPVLTAVSNGMTAMVNGIIKGVNWISEALDKVGLGWGKTAEFSYTTSYADDLGKQMDGIMNSIKPSQAPAGYKSLDGYKMNFQDPRANMVKGYAFGDKLSNDPLKAMQNTLGLGADPAMKALIDGQNKSNKLAEQTVKNTAPLTSDQFKYVKDIMVGRTIDRISDRNIRIEMVNNNNINSALDVDAIVNTLAQKLTKAMDSTAEGVHY
jgi:tape measure domain-containing protein